MVCEELGRGLVNAPFTFAALMAPRLLAVAPAALQAQWLPGIASGDKLVVPALTEAKGRYRLAHVETRATRSDNGWTLSGAKCVVPAGDEADGFIVPARIGGAAGGAAGIGLFIVEAAAAQVTAYATYDGARAADARFDQAAAGCITEDGLAVLEDAVDAGIAAQCAEAVGLMDRLVAVTIDYMNTRKQFGVTIASFQALRHRIADVKMQLELGALDELLREPEARRADSAAAAVRSRRPGFSLATACASSASNASSCTAASPAPTNTSPATTSSG